MREITVKFLVMDWQMEQLQQIADALDRKQKYSSKHTAEEVFDMIMTGGSIYTIADKINSWANLLLLTPRMTPGRQRFIILYK